MFHMNTTAVDILKQSFNFYGRLFNKIFWLSVAYSLLPMLIGGAIMGGGAANNSIGIMLLGIAVAMFTVCFFYAYQVVLINQFSEDKNDSLKDALPIALSKTFPFVCSALALGFVFLIVTIPVAGIAGSYLGEDLTPESDPIKFMVISLIILAPIAWLAYRFIFVPFHVILNGSSIISAFGKSNQQVKSDWLVFRGLNVIGLIFIIYMVGLFLIQFMIALNPMLIAFVQFAFGILISPFFTIYLYRLFVVTQQKSQNESQSTDLDADD